MHRTPAPAPKTTHQARGWSHSPNSWSSTAPTCCQSTSPGAGSQGTAQFSATELQTRQEGALGWEHRAEGPLCGTALLRAAAAPCKPSLQKTTHTELLHFPPRAGRSITALARGRSSQLSPSCTQICGISALLLHPGLQVYSCNFFLQRATSETSGCFVFICSAAEFLGCSRGWWDGNYHKTLQSSTA